jgi:hypothetical protein
MDAMNNEVISQAKGEKEICSFDIPDEALGRAASVERQSIHLALHHHPYRGLRHLYL